MSVFVYLFICRYLRESEGEIESFLKFKGGIQKVL